MPYDMDAACEVVADCITELGGRALVVGLSLGGYVGIATAARHPALVAGLADRARRPRGDRTSHRESGASRGFRGTGGNSCPINPTMTIIGIILPRYGQK
jgi:pimeloyl-ACP methyl ester carboxylesterase